MSQGPPATLIAICGATGVGKSSILNAILQCNIIPTSCSQACTSVVTEISYHDEATIIGEVDFLTEDEWKSEISALFSDLVGDHGVATRRPVDTKTPSGVAWHKIQAVYPEVKFEELVHMTVDRVMALDRRVIRTLGTTKELVSDSAEGFSRMIREYIDSSYQPPEHHLSSIKARFRPSAFWPLIRQVRVRCNAEALSTGAVLVDLPGIGDANVARNLVAKDYMKKANCVWILAPIVRAVDDKIARDLLGEAFKLQLKMDGNYDDHSITFVATKCDDIACAEVIGTLNLDNNPRLQAMEGRIADLNVRLEELQERHCSSKIVAEAFSHEVARLEREKDMLDSRIEALQSADMKSIRVPPDDALPGDGPLKRKLDTTNVGRPPKRQRQVEEHVKEADGSLGGDGLPSIDHGALEQQRMECEESLQTALSRAWNASKKRCALEVEEQEIETELGLARKDIYAFCSLERSEHSRGIIIEDFRAGLRELEATPDCENECNGVNLPVFTCSSRDYLRMTKQVDGGEDATCFCNIEDTGIPALQKWCHRLTVASRGRTARSFLARLLAFTTSIQIYARGIGNVTAEDRAAFQSKWESAGEKDISVFLVRELGESGHSDTLDGMHSVAGGIAVRLSQGFSELVDVCVRDLKRQLRVGLSQKCKNGTTKAAEKAVGMVDKLAASMDWNAYRATLARDGIFHIDLNVELAGPFTKSIARSWSSQFRHLSFRPLEDEILKRVANLLREVQDSATIGLQDRANILTEVCLEEARVIMKQCMHRVKGRVVDHQKDISRTMAPHVRKQLREGYKRAMAECGTGGGSARRRKALFRDFVDQNKERIFQQGFDVVMGKVDQAAKSVGNALDGSLEELAQKVEVNFSTIWEVYQDDPAQVRAREHVADVATHTCEQLKLWLNQTTPSLIIGPLSRISAF